LKDQKLSPQLDKDFAWAKSQFDNLLFGTILNMKFYQAGICPKLIVDMNDDDMKHYLKILETIFK
jgi:hypothetical protein